MRAEAAAPQTARVAIARRLRIAHVTPSYYPAVRYGGPIVSVHGLCKALAARGHDVEVFTTNVDGDGASAAPLDAPVDLDGVKVHYFEAGVGRRLFRAPALARALKREIVRFDVAHLHSVFLWPTTAAARIARLHSTPYVLSPRGMLVPELIEAKSRWLKRAWILAFEKANVAGAASVHVTADLEARRLRELGFRSRRIEVAPNGVEALDFLDEAEPRRTRRVLYLGRLSWKKRLDCLIRALVHAPEAELTVCGFDDEGLRPRLEALARKLGLDDRIRWLDPVTGAEKWALIRSCDLFALPSSQENFGVAALEALACGRPAVVAPGVGLAEAIVGAGAGLCVESEPRALGSALAALLADEAARMRMGEAGKALARCQYSWEAVAARMERIYLDSIEG
jgi:glycosyltransferase involved in cell wall biosynthesis